MCATAMCGKNNVRNAQLRCAQIRCAQMTIAQIQCAQKKIARISNLVNACNARIGTKLQRDYNMECAMDKNLVGPTLSI